MGRQPSLGKEELELFYIPQNALIHFFMPAAFSAYEVLVYRLKKRVTVLAIHPFFQLVKVIVGQNGVGIFGLVE
ncbi:hypothetical protein V7200_20765 [Cytobacillus firmus]|uniref:hypothetical protein n=1 Tax=Cytobacillus firmus TaxID=1399 RepID=UPI00300089DC